LRLKVKLIFFLADYFDLLLHVHNRRDLEDLYLYTNGLLAGRPGFRRPVGEINIYSL